MIYLTCKCGSTNIEMNGFYEFKCKDCGKLNQLYEILWYEKPECKEREDSTEQSVLQTAAQSIIM